MKHHKTKLNTIHETPKQTTSKLKSMPASLDLLRDVFQEENANYSIEGMRLGNQLLYKA
jgi:hypothetical protein